MHSKTLHFYRPRISFFSRFRGARTRSAVLTPGSALFFNSILLAALFVLVTVHVYVAVVLSSAPLRLSKLQAGHDILLDEVKQLEGSIREFETPTALEQKAHALGMVAVPHYEFISPDRAAFAKK